MRELSAGSRPGSGGESEERGRELRVGEGLSGEKRAKGGLFRGVSVGYLSVWDEFGGLCVLGGHRKIPRFVTANWGMIVNF